jgi:hypothetical protein
MESIIVPIHKIGVKLGYHCFPLHTTFHPIFFSPLYFATAAAACCTVSSTCSALLHRVLYMQRLVAPSIVHAASCCAVYCTCSVLLHRVLYMQLIVAPCILHKRHNFSPSRCNVRRCVKIHVLEMPVFCCCYCSSSGDHQ